MNTYTWEIPCPHEANPRLLKDVPAPDHHPLDREEVMELLLLAERNLNDGRLLNKIPIRLCQAIPDKVCPEDSDSKVRKSAATITRLFVDFVNDHPLYNKESVVEKIMEIISG